MADAARDEVTALLRKMEQGDQSAAAAFFGLIYDDLHERARQMIPPRSRQQTLQATALVHEAYLRLVQGPERNWPDRARFLSVAALAMRHALVDHARARGRRKRSPQGHEVQLDGVVAAYEDRAIDIEALDAALRKMADFNPQMARAVELRFFGGASVDETARILEISRRTFERRWEAARAWLRAEIE